MRVSHSKLGRYMVKMTSCAKVQAEAKGCLGAKRHIHKSSSGEHHSAARQPRQNTAGTSEPPSLVAATVSSSAHR